MVPKVEPEGTKLKLIIGNVRNLIPFSNRNKVRLIEDISSFENVGIVLLTEAHLKSEIEDAEISMMNNHCHRVDRNNCK